MKFIQLYIHTIKKTILPITYFYIVFIIACSIIVSAYVPSLPLYHACYNTIESQIESFDLLFFTCDELTSYIGKVCQTCAYTHVGMTFRINNMLYLWEADNHDSIYYKGVDLIPLKKVLDDYPSKHYALQKMNINKKIAKKSLYYFLKTYLKKHKNKNFKYELTTFINAFMKKNTTTHISSIKDGFFCSELIAHTMIHCKLMKKTFPYWAYTPSDFYYKRIVLKKGVSYGKLMPFMY